MMEQRQLNDESVYPGEDQIFSILGEHALVWKQTMEYLDAQYSDITQNWKYYKDAKCWMLRILKKKNTLCWILVLDDTFRIAFYFAERLAHIIYDSKLSLNLKEQYRHAKPFNKSRAIYIDVENTKDLENIKTLIDLKSGSMS